jgi:hypothetical protein
MGGFTSETGNYLSICLYVQIVLLVLGGRYINDGTTLAVALGLTAVHGGMLELLHTFIVLSAVLLPVDIYVFWFGGLKSWLVFFLVLLVASRVGCVWFGCAPPHLCPAGCSHARPLLQPDIVSVHQAASFLIS